LARLKKEMLSAFGDRSQKKQMARASDLSFKFFLHIQYIHSRANVLLGAKIVKHESPLPSSPLEKVYDVLSYVLEGSSTS